MDVKRKIWMRALSVFLATLMVIQILPLNAFAKDVVQKQAIEDTQPKVSDNDEITVKTEIESMRTENSKTFLTDDNGYYQITSAIPLHNRVDDEWVDKSNSSNTEVNTVSDIETYVNEQIDAELSTQSEENQPVKTITSNGDTYVDNCQTQIGTYSSSGNNNLSVIYKRDKKDTKRSEIYIKPYFPTDHAVFVTSATIKAEVSTENIVGDYNLIEENAIASEWSSGVQSSSLIKDITTNYDLVEMYVDDGDSDSKVYNFDLTKYCNFTRIGLIQNNGVALTSEQKGTDVTFDNLTVEMYYHEIEDVDSNFEYEQVDLGRAGKVYINDYTCSPVIVRDELSLYGEIAPVSIQTIFNPMDNIDDIGFGKHTRINYYSTLTYDEKSRFYLWKNCEGENLYFKNYKVTGANNITYTRSGSVSKDSNGNYNFNKITITDSNGKKFKFDTYNNVGYLVEITDGSQNNNSITIDYSIENDSHFLTKVTDGYGRKYCFSYSNGHLSALNVLNSDNEPIYINTTDTEHPLKIMYNYSNNLLKSVTYADEKEISYIYGEDDKIEQIKNIDDSKLLFKYESKFDGESYKISKYSSVSSNGSTNDTMTISAIDQSIYNRKFTKNDKTSKELTFDRNFNMIRLKNYNNVEYFLNYSNNELQYILTSDTVAENFVKNGSFEDTSGGQPTQWVYETNSSQITQNKVKMGDDEDNYTLHMSNDIDVCRAYQIVEKSGYTFKANKSYVLSGFLYNNDNPISISDTRDLCIYVYDTKTDSNGAIIPDKCLTKMDFDDTLGETWQQRKTLFTTQKDTSSIIVYLSYNNMSGTCDFDNIEIYETTSKNLIDAKNIVSSTDIEYDYSENNSILEEIKTSVDGDEIGAFYNYTDDENYISKVTNNGIPTYYNYDSDSGLLLSKGNNSDTNKNAQYNYTAVGLLKNVNQAVTEIDGKSTININTNYGYENDKIKTINHNGTTYEYSYDSNGRVASVSEYASNSQNKNTIVSYEYSNDDIGTIAYGNGAKIIYEYNQLGYTTKIIYIPKTSDESHSQIVYSYEYDNDGNVTSYTDNSNNTTLTIKDGVYTIKESGENGQTIYLNNGTNRTLYGTKITTTNPKVTTSAGKTTDSKVLNLYTDGKILPSNVVTATTIYDSIGRTFSTIATDKTATVENKSSFMTKGITTTNLVETYISSVTRLKDASEPRIYRKLTYSYNDRGQITDVYRASVNNIVENFEGTSNSVNNMKNQLLKHYEYDEAGQVILDVNFDSCIAIKYKYNAGGNLVSKATYENDNSEDKSAFYYKKSTNKYVFNEEKAVVTTYGYSSEWSDVLNNYNGKEITYDEMGNPTTYVGKNIFGSDINGNMVWDGTRLSSFDDGDQKYIYKYSADGYRTQKLTYNSKNPNELISTMNYIYENDILVGHKTVFYNSPDKELKQTVKCDIISNIIYNSTNESIGIDTKLTQYEYTTKKDENGEESTVVTPTTNKFYFYILRDGQGNITDMYNANEDLTIHFSYDAYGNCSMSFAGSFIHDIKQQLQGSSSIWIKLLLGFLYAIIFSALASGEMTSTQQTYKGYICDYETGLYYSQNRFYSPSWGRFINADDINMLAQNKGEVLGANLFNYCNNDPVNNVDLSGYAPTSYDTASNILSALNIEQLNTIKVGVVPAKLQGKVKNEMTIFGLSLATVQDKDDKNYWNRVFKTTENVVQKSNGNNYMDTVINKQSGAATMYDIKPSSSPYKIGE